MVVNYLIDNVARYDGGTRRDPRDIGLRLLASSIFASFSLLTPDALTKTVFRKARSYGLLVANRVSCESRRLVG